MRERVKFEQSFAEGGGASGVGWRGLQKVSSPLLIVSHSDGGRGRAGGAIYGSCPH